MEPKWNQWVCEDGDQLLEDRLFEAVAGLHALSPEAVVLLRQNGAALYSAGGRTDSRQVGKELPGIRFDL